MGAADPSGPGGHGADPAEEAVSEQPVTGGHGPRSFGPFLALEAATLISGIGNGVSTIALPWLTLKLTGDPAAAGVVVAAAAVPTLVTSLSSGVIIDRLGRQRTSVGSDVFSAASAALIPVLALAGALTYAWVLIASVVGAMFDPVGVTAREAMLPDVAKRARLRLERVNGIHEAVWGVAWLVGPGIAGFLIAAVGAEASFWALFVGFVASAVLVATACMPTPAPHEGAGEHWLREALDGVRFVARDAGIRSTTVLMTLAFTLAYSVIAVVLPVIFERLDQPERLGVLFMAYSAGGVVGSLAYGAAGERVSRRLAFIVGLVSAALVPVTFIASPPYALQVGGMVITGFLSGPVGPIFNVVLQERTPDAMRGRALSTAFALEYALFPVGYVAAGLLIKGVGVSSTLTLMAGLTALVAAWSLFTPALRGLGPEGGGLPTD